MEARIQELRHKLTNATVGEATFDGTIAAGTVVTASVGGREMRFLVGSREIAGTADIDVFSPTSPLGAAINGTKVGDKTSYTAPNGNDIPVTILGAKPFDA